jgi:peptidoglycan-associated lipoprotein
MTDNGGGKMALQVRRRHEMLILWLMVLTILPGCSTRRINSGMDDQASVSRSSSAPIEVEKVAPPVRVEEPEMRLSQQPPAVEPSFNPVPPPSRRVPELSDVYFDFDRDAIRSDTRSKLKGTATILKAQPDHAIILEGHCDERGTNAYNLILGERRAQAVKRHLQDLGLAESQFQIVSYGKERPVCTEHSEACRQLNRRVHFSWP